MKTIWKFPLHIARQTVSMPAQSKVLCVQSQGEQIVMWALVDTNQPNIERTFIVYGTGHVSAEANAGGHIGTVQILGLVWHVFEL